MNKLITTVKRVAPNAIVIDIELPKNPATWQGFLHITSDIHYDHQKCRRDILENHLAIAAARDAVWIDNGDLHCAMQGKYDKRSNLDALRDEYKVSDYLNKLVHYAAEMITPHAERLVMSGKGNHETSQLDHHGFDLTTETIAKVKAAKPACRAMVGGYATYVTFRFKKGRWSQTIKAWFMHGYGGGGPVTKDLIQLARQLAYIDNADIMVSGHTHDSWVVPFTRMNINRHGKPKRRVGTAIKCPTMKDEYGTGVGGWSIERGHPPKPLGSYLIRFTYSRKDERVYFKPIPLDENDKPENNYA